jgi:hypothetical protein
MRTTRKSSDENARNGKYSNVNEGWFWWVYKFVIANIICPTKIEGEMYWFKKV